MKAPDCEHQYSWQCTVHTHLSPVITETNTKHFRSSFFSFAAWNSQCFTSCCICSTYAKCDIYYGLLSICLRFIPPQRLRWHTDLSLHLGMLSPHQGDP